MTSNYRTASTVFSFDVFFLAPFSLQSFYIPTYSSHFKITAYKIGLHWINNLKQKKEKTKTMKQYKLNGSWKIKKKCEVREWKRKLLKTDHKVIFLCYWWMTVSHKIFFTNGTIADCFANFSSLFNGIKILFVDKTKQLIIASIRYRHLHRYTCNNIFWKFIWMILEFLFLFFHFSFSNSYFVDKFHVESNSIWIRLIYNMISFNKLCCYQI